jgi:hypothetical protein
VFKILFVITAVRLRLVNVTHCNVPQNIKIVLKFLKLNPPCVQYGLFGKVNVSLER